MRSLDVQGRGEALVRTECYTSAEARVALSNALAESRAAGYCVIQHQGHWEVHDAEGVMTRYWLSDEPPEQLHSVPDGAGPTLELP